MVIKLHQRLSKSTFSEHRNFKAYNNPNRHLFKILSGTRGEWQALWCWGLLLDPPPALQQPRKPKALQSQPNHAAWPPEEPGQTRSSPKATAPTRHCLVCLALLIPDIGNLHLFSFFSQWEQFSRSILIFLTLINFGFHWFFSTMIPDHLVHRSLLISLQFLLFWV